MNINQKTIFYSIMSMSFILSLCVLEARAYTVYGSLKESPSGEACIGASVICWAPSDSTSTSVLTVADDEGCFKSTLKSPGEYKILFKYLGCKDVEKTFKVNASAPDADLGEVKMPRDDKTLEELLVIARRKLVSSDGGTLTYNVEDDPSAKTSSTLEMLRHVPMVSVDAEENVRVNGSTGFKIYINGKEDPALAGDVKTVLKSLPASTIKKIEVITDPGAKYDAEGTGGILNIVTQTRTRIEGYTANLNLNFSSNSINVSAYAMTKIKNVTMSLAGYTSNSTFRRYTTSEKENIIESSESEHHYVNKQRDLAQPYNFSGGNFSLSWEPDTLNLFTLAFNINGNVMKSTSTQNAVMYDMAGLQSWRYDSEFRKSRSNLSMSAAASFQHTFRKMGHHIIGSIIMDYGNNSGYSNQEFMNVESAPVPGDFKRSEQDGNFHKYTAQIDYANPFNEHHLLEAGFKGVWRRDRSDSRVFLGPSFEMLLPVENDRVDMRQFRDIMAGYVSYTGNYWKISVRAGLRYEYTRQGLRYLIGAYPDFTSHLNDFVPNASVSFRITPQQTLRLAYNMRIYRPSIGELNPYVNTNVNAISYGNPDLKSEKANNIDISYSNYGNALGGSVGLSYSRTGNSIAGYTFIGPDDIVNTTRANIGKEQYAGMRVNLQWTPVSSLQLGFFGNINYTEYHADSPDIKASNHGWSENLNANFDYTFPFGMRLSGYGGWGSGWINLQTVKSGGYYYYGLSMSRDFLKEKRLTLTLSTSNFAPAYAKYNSIEAGEDFKTTVNLRYPQWSVNFAISYRLGSLKASVKRTNADLETESTRGSAGNSGAGPR